MLQELGVCSGEEIESTLSAWNSFLNENLDKVKSHVPKVMPHIRVLLVHDDLVCSTVHDVDMSHNVFFIRGKFTGKSLRAPVGRICAGRQ